MTIKMLAFDLDGTLLLPDKTIDPRTRAAIEKAIDQGIHIAIASGRDKNGCEFVFKQLDLENKGENYLALINGQIIYDLKRKEYDLDDVLTPEDGIKIEKVCRKYDVEGIFCCGYDFYSYLSEESRRRKREEAIKNGTPADYGLRTASEKRNFIELDVQPYTEFTQDINKVCMAHKKEWFEDHLDELKAELKDYDLLLVGPEWLEIMPKGISKASALDKIAHKLGFTMNEVMAFGDAENDLAMIEAAGIGVAMGNGMSTLKEKADLITDTNLNNGIGQVIEALLDGKEDDLRQGILPPLKTA